MGIFFKPTHGGILKAVRSLLTTALDVSVSGQYALDAAAGKALNDRLTRLESYSTEEQVVGTWMGKPLYRKVFLNLPFPTTSSNGNRVWVYFDVNSLNISEVVMFHGYCRFKNSRATIHMPLIPGFGGVNDYLMTMTMDNSKINISNSNANYVSANTFLYAIAEYTKTTD